VSIETAKFIGSARTLEECPPARRPEVALIGRSNVGKSSLVNLLTKQKGLARVSKKPGATRLINFFLMNEHWHLVDLPGYGFAKVSKEMQEGFGEAVTGYLAGRKGLELVCVLVDARYEPLELDLGFLNWLEGCPAKQALVFTKTDQAAPEHWRRNMEIYAETLDAHGLPVPEMIPCSASERAGRGALLQHISGVLPRPKRKGSGSGVQLGWMKRGQR